jgi:hypothetical protein
VSVNLIELNDRNVRLRNQDEILLESPGFANIVEKQPVFGEEARKVARLHPRQTFSQFWSQLSLDPLANSDGHFRHQADLAFAHLNSIAGQQALTDEVIFAVPSNYNRNQLSILLGLVQSCEFDAVGLVDLALLRTAGADNPDKAVYLDIQLHQCVLTTFTKNDGGVVRDKMVQIPGTGLLALHNAWANMAADEFIKQSRFDPQHNAETEQYVHNQLFNWIDQARMNNEIMMEINNKGSVYQARVNTGHFEQKVRNIFGRVKEELETLAGHDYLLHLQEDHAELPGLSLYLSNLIPVTDNLLMESCILHLDHIKGEPGSLNFITSLPGTEQSSSPATTTKANNAPSHVLINNKAYALPAQLQFGPINGNSPAGSSAIQVEAAGGSGDLRISVTTDGVLLDIQGVGNVQLNGLKAEPREVLKLGDAIRLPGSDALLQLIQVE